MNPLYIFDLDGTLADCTHRQPLIQRDKPHWDAFYDACDQDKPIATIMYLLRILLWTGAEVWIFSGRSDRTLAKTADWLQRYGLEPNEYQLVMRPDGDYTPDDELKQRYLDNMLEVDRKRLVCVFDDRDRVVAMWRRNGITCLQVAPGAF